MKNRITDLFATKKKDILSVFFTAGFPKLDDTTAIARYLEEAGADLIEIGIPFSDPVADGPVIQESNKIALDNGISVKKILEQVREIRTTVKLPIILMGYLNPVMQYGMEKFAKEAAESGVDGLILPDLPMDEFRREYQELFESHGLTNTFLISPTTAEERIREIDQATTGFVYAVSASSTTGAKGDFSEGQETYFRKLQSLGLKNPYLIGFGISNYQTFSRACSYASGAIVGSAFVTMLKQSSNLKEDIAAFVRGLRSES